MLSMCGGPLRTIGTRIFVWRQGRKDRAHNNARAHTLPMAAGAALVLTFAVSAGVIAQQTAPARTVQANDTKAEPAPETTGIIGETPPPAPQPQAAPLPTEPAPKRSSPEALHVQRYDDAIAAARAYAPSLEDAVRLREAFAAIGGRTTGNAKALRDQISDPVAKKMIDWYLYRQGVGTAREIRAFVDANPTWPDRNALMTRAEESLFTYGGSAKDLKAFFGTDTPKTGIGLAALASAYVAEQDQEKAKAAATKAWREYDIPASLETGFLERFKPLLTDADHRVRLDRLLLDDVRWNNERNERAAFIRRTIAALSSPVERRKAEARLAVFTRAKLADQLLAALPAEDRADWGLMFQRAQQHRRQGRHEEAWKILTTAPVDPALVGNLDDWWDERQLAVYDALKLGQFPKAYELAKTAGSLSANPRKEATFLAGWIALRYLQDAKAAEPHFRALEAAADGPLSYARAGYWLGRTYEALGDAGKAREKYAAASQYVDTFHGQLALHKADPALTAIPIKPPAVPTPEQAAKFTSLDSVRAAVVARKASLDSSIVRAFISGLRTALQDEHDMAMLAHLAEALADTQMAVKVGKLAVSKGQNLLYYAYPIHPLPAYTPLRPPVEPAMLLGIARQESEFNPGTLSGAGARGILQVMPITAQHVCRDYRQKCDIPRLSTDPSYNVMMASAYIADRMDEVAGSYILTLTGYNAGPGRTRQWIREIADPRDPKIDAIDWIMRIPFEETREYVQKVLANIQIYRARLGQEATALRLGADLARAAGKQAQRPPATTNN